MNGPRPVLTLVISSFDRGGTERQMTELVRRLDRTRFDVHVVCFRKSGPWLPVVDAHASSVTEFPLRSLKSFSTARQIAALAGWFRTIEVDLVHTWDIYANLVALPAAALARVPVRIGSRRGIASPIAVRGALRLQRLAYRAAHRVVANAAAAARQLQLEGVDAAAVTVIPNGIVIEGPPAGAASQAAPIVITVANLRAGKGHDVLLRAAAQVVAAHPAVRFQFVGDGPLRGALEAQARELGIAAQVEFLGHRDDVNALLRRSTVFAFPSLMEAFPNGVMEAMAVGLPVVASNVGGIPELVDDGRNGLLVPAGDADGLASVINRLLGDPVQARIWGDAARQTIAAGYSFERMTRAFEGLYQRELAARHGRVGNALPNRSSIRL